MLQTLPTLDAARASLQESPESTALPVLLAQERNITAGTLKVNDAYDLSLYRLPSGDFEVVVFMKLQFFFESGPGGHWSEIQQAQYVHEWRATIEAVWGGHHLHRTGCGKSVALRFALDIQVGGWMRDHWEITVTKIATGEFSRSCVDVRMGNALLDSEDLRPVLKRGNSLQRGAVHEFGHMLGLSDEYSASSSLRQGSQSVMSSGEAILPHHHDTMRRWVIFRLAQHGFK